MQYNNLKNRAIKILIGDSYPLAFTGQMPNDMKELFIDMADEIFVINVGGYIGESTKSEIEYARKNGKGVQFLENNS